MVKTFLAFCLKHKSALLVLLGIAVIAGGMAYFVTPTHAASEVTVVTNLADAGPGSLRDAVANVRVRGTVQIATELAGTIVLTSGPINSIKGYTLVGNGQVTISANGQSRLFYIQSNLTTIAIQDVSLTSGTDVQGGAIFNQGTLVLTRVNLSNSKATQKGGAIYNAGSLTLSAVNLTSNSVVNTGGDAFGGAIYNDQGSLAVDNVNFTSNTANSAGVSVGGAIFNFNTPVTMNAVNFTGNAAISPLRGNGGAIDNLSGTMTITNGFFTNNYIQGGTTLSDGSEVSAGGVINNAGVLSITTGSFSGNTIFSAGGSGGAISSSAPGSLTVNNVTFTSNTLQGGAASNVRGGAIDSISEALVVIDCRFLSNASHAGPNGSAWGGAISTSGLGSGFPATLLRVDMESNIAYADPGLDNPAGSVSPGGSALGGGIYNQVNYMNIDSSYISKNAATGGNAGTSLSYGASGGGSQGGGIMLMGGKLTLTNGTQVAANTATGGAGGASLSSGGGNGGVALGGGIDWICGFAAVQLGIDATSIVAYNAVVAAPGGAGNPNGPASTVLGADIYHC